MAKKCGCGSGESPSADAEHLLVAVTASSANSCGDPSAAVTGTDSCAKQEPEFDILLSDFVVPVHGSTITINVCNNNVYTLNQYLEFIGYGLQLRIQEKSSDGKSMLLVNSCVNNNEIGNPDAGLAVTKNTTFHAVVSPRCANANDELLEVLNTVEEICTDSLEEGGANATYAVVGRVETDPDDDSAGKCIKRIAGFLFKLGSVFLPNITTVDEADHQNYRRVGIKSDGQTAKIRAIRDFLFGGAGLITGYKYIFAGSSTVTEKPVGPAYIASFFPTPKLFEEQGTVTDYTTYTAIATGVTFSKDFSLAIPEITDNLKNKDLQNHYYLMVHLIVASQGNSGGGTRSLTIKLNDETVAVLIGNNGPLANSDSLVIPIKILNSASNFNLKIVADGNLQKYYYKIRGLGAYI